MTQPAPMHSTPAALLAVAGLAWQALSAPPAPHTDIALGYESALPWTLDVEPAQDGQAAPHGY